MRLYLLELYENYVGWDCICSVVVRASSELEARNLVALEHRDEGPDTWLDQSKSTCVEIPIDGDAEIICTDILEG